MKEKYLHYLWQYKRLPFHNLQLKNGQSFKILYVGDYNAYESGPDFLNAKIEIDSIVWSGNVEIHVKSSEWYDHKHHTDSAYDTVILHVVFEDNKDVVQNGYLLPVLELKNVIDQEHFKKFDQLLKSKKTILCGSQFKHVNDFSKVEMMELALVERLNRKTRGLFKECGTDEPKQVLYFLLARAMGAKINKLPFEELTQRLPISILKQIQNHDQKLLLQLTSGMFSPSSYSEMIEFTRIIKRHEITGYGIMNRKSWKFGGTRPGNSPDKRLLQFTEIIKKFDFEISFIYLSAKEIYSYCIALLSFDSSHNAAQPFVKPLTLAFKEQLIINWVVPFLYWFGQHTQDDLLCEKAFELLRMLPAEDNSIVGKWKEFGVKPNNAADSQALLEIFNEFCTKKKCLSCKIGYSLLNT